MAQDFFSFLVDETLKLQQSGEAQLSSFELKLSDYNLGFIKGEFIPQSQVLRFKTSFGLIDIPINWSVFSLENESGHDHVISAENDHDHLLELMKIHWNSAYNKLLITHADGFCYVVGLKVGEEYYIHDLLNPQELLKAA